MSFLIGVIVGSFGGLVGLGGGVIMVPLTVFAFKLVQKEAHGTSLVAVVFTGITAAIAYASKGAVDYLAAGLLAGAAIFTARAGARYCHALPEWKLKRFFGGFLVLVSLVLILKPLLAFSPDPLEGWIRVAALLIIGAISGFLSGLLGIGGGAFMVPAMVLVVGMSQHMAQGSSLLCMIPAGAVGAYTHWGLGNVAKPLLPGLVGGTLIGALLGGIAANLLPETILRLVFAVVMIWIGIQYMRFPAPASPKK